MKTSWIPVMIRVLHAIAITTSLGLAVALAFKDDNQRTGVVSLYVKPISTRQLSLLDPILSRITQDLPRITVPAEIESAADKAAAAFTSALEKAKDTITLGLFGNFTLGTRHGCVQIQDEAACLDIGPMSSLLVGSIAFACISLVLDVGLIFGFEWAVVLMVISDLVLSIFSAVVVVYANVSLELFSAVAARLQLGVERGTALEHAFAMLALSIGAAALCFTSLWVTFKARLKA